MDLRTKLIFALVAVSLGSMLVFGLVIEPQVEVRLRERTLAELDRLADAKSESLVWIIAGWRDRVDLIASRAQLRTSLAEHLDGGGGEAVDRIERVLADAMRASETLTLLEVLDPEGATVASADRGGVAARSVAEALSASATAPRLEAEVPADGAPMTTYEGVEFIAPGPAQVSFAARLVEGVRPIGSLVAVFEARELVALTTRAQSLGETGEMLIVARDASGAARTLHPSRFDGIADGGSVLANVPGALWARALAGETEPVRGVVDYRGETVWAATRYVPETGWGVVVKVDEREQLRPYEEFDAWLRRTALILAAFAILGGFALGMRFAMPIQSLATAAERIRKGEMDARAPVLREDEVGVLARAFNEMADDLEERMTLLHEFRKFFDVSIDMMCIAGTDGYFKRINPAFVKELGWSEEELLARPFFDFVHPDDVGPTQREVDELARGIPTISFVNRFRCVDGSWKRLEWTSYPEEGTGKLYAIAHVMPERGAP